jgi:hypothetical protein
MANDSRSVARSDYSTNEGVEVVLRTPIRLPDRFSVEWIVAFGSVSRLHFVIVKSPLTSLEFLFSTAVHNWDAVREEGKS